MGVLNNKQKLHNNDTNSHFIQGSTEKRTNRVR